MGREDVKGLNTFKRIIEGNKNQFRLHFFNR